jgi:hypothetical protein
MAKVKPPG